MVAVVGKEKIMMNEKNISKCRGCGQRIIFVKMKSGKSMPVNEAFVNYKKVDGGKDRIVTPNGDVVSCISGVSAREADGYGYVSHFATCPSATRHRKLT